MTSSSMHLGPRGWAVLTLLGGAALSTPFMRTDSSATAVGEATSHPLQTPNPWNAQLPAEGPAHIASSHMPIGGNSIHPRFVSGELPTTSVVEHKQTDLPAWVRERSPLDELIDEAGESAPDTDWREIASDEPRSPIGLRPWREQSLMPVTPNARDTSAHRESMAAGERLRSTVDADPFAPSTLPMVALGQNDVPDNRWPDQELLPSLTEIAQGDQRPAAPRSFGESSPGNLVGTALRRLPVGNTKDNTIAPDRLVSNSTSNAEQKGNVPGSRKFVYQPGFQGSHTSKP